MNDMKDEIFGLLGKDFDSLAAESGHTPEEANELVRLGIENSRKVMGVLQEETIVPNMQNDSAETANSALNKVIKYLKGGLDSKLHKMAERLKSTSDINADMSDIAGFPDGPILFFAFFNDKKRLLDLVLDARPDMSITDSRGRNILMQSLTYKTSYDEKSIIRLLENIKNFMSAGTDIISQKDKNGDTALDIISKRLHNGGMNDMHINMIYDIIKVYDKTFGLTKKQIYTEKIVAELKRSKLSDLRDFGTIIQNSGDINSKNPQGDTLLSILVTEQKYDLLDDLCGAGVDPSIPFDTGNGSTTPITHLRAQSGRDNESAHDKLIMQASEISNICIAIEALKRYPDYLGDVDRISKGFDIDARDPANRMTAMMKAVKDGNIELISILKAAGARFDAIEENGFTPLMFAVLGGDKDMVETVLREGHLSAAQKLNFQLLTAENIANRLGLLDIEKLIATYISEEDYEILF